MGVIENPFIPSRGRLIITYLYFNVFRTNIFTTIFLNSKRLVFYVRYFSKMKELGRLLSLVPITDGHRFKIKFGALSDNISCSIPFKRVLPSLIDNYSIILNHFSPESMSKITADGLECWRQDIYSIKLTKIKDYDLEGSFALVFVVEDQQIYTFGFNFFRDFKPGSDKSWILYISRKQGQFGVFDLIKKTSKVFNHDKVESLVLAAAEGLALALNVQSIVGVGTENQLSFPNLTDEMKVIFEKSYNAYWNTLVAVKLDSGDYLMTVPMKYAENELEESSHRMRTQLKREQKQVLSADVRDFFTSIRVAQAG